MNRLLGISLVLAIGAPGAMVALADPVWDPTEIVRLSSQAAQLAGNLSTTIDILQAYDQLGKEVGAVGGRAFTSQAPATMLRFSALISAGMPTSSDAQAAFSEPAVNLSQIQKARQLWRDAYQKSEAEGLTTALVVSQDAGSAPARSQTLARMASGSQDLRSDMQANSAVCLAVLSELGAIQAALALMLEQQSSARLIKISDNGGRV